MRILVVRFHHDGGTLQLRVVGHEYQGVTNPVTEVKGFSGDDMRYPAIVDA